MLYQNSTITFTFSDGSVAASLPITEYDTTRYNEYVDNPDDADVTFFMQVTSSSDVYTNTLLNQTPEDSKALINLFFSESNPIRFTQISAERYEENKDYYTSFITFYGGNEQYYENNKNSLTVNLHKDDNKMVVKLSDVYLLAEAPVVAQLRSSGYAKKVER